jgi:hypothetical protein
MIKEFVEKHGVENVIILNPMLPIQDTGFGFGFTSSVDEAVVVPCTIDESRYKVSEGYKITLKSMYDNFGKEDLYQLDFDSLWRKQYVEVFIRAKIEE